MEQNDFKPTTLGFYHKENISNLYRFCLDEDIGDLPYYRDLIHALNNATEDDVIELRIITDGGSLETAECIITAIRSSEASVVGIVEKAYSAGSMIALACPELVLTDFATMMIHTGSYGTVGSHNKVKQYVDFSERKLNRVIEDVYEGFLTKEEINSVKDGSDFWMFAEEIGERLDRRNEYFQQKAEAKQEKEEEEVKPRTRKKVVAKEVVVE